MPKRNIYTPNPDFNRQTRGTILAMSTVNGDANNNGRVENRGAAESNGGAENRGRANRGPTTLKQLAALEVWITLEKIRAFRVKGTIPDSWEPLFYF